YVALRIALQKLLRHGGIKTMPLREAVAATSVGMVDGVPMLDLCYEEDSRAEVDMNVVMTAGGKFVEVQATAEHIPFEDAKMAKAVALAKNGIAHLAELQKKATQV